MYMLAQLQATPQRILIIDDPLSAIVTGGSAYLTRSGQSVAVTLHGPRDPRGPNVYPVARHRVYLPLEWVQHATEPRQSITGPSIGDTPKAAPCCGANWL
jgi:hypothetical protein